MILLGKDDGMFQSPTQFPAGFGYLTSKLSPQLRLILALTLVVGQAANAATTLWAGTRSLAGCPACMTTSLRRKIETEISQDKVT